MAKTIKKAAESSGIEIDTILPSLQIEPELEQLLPPLSEAELDGLEADILQRGVLSPLVAWNGMLIDGHHRYKICTKHSLKYPLRTLEFESLESAKLWAWRHQENRRNLTPYQQVEISLKFKQQIAAEAKNNCVAGGGDRKSKNAKSGLQIVANPIDTKKEVAKIADVSHTTLDRAEYIANHADEATKQKLRVGETTINAEFKRLKKESELADAKRKVKEQTKNDVVSKPPTIFLGDGVKWINQQEYCDLLLTDPPYSTDVPNIKEFAQNWLPAALRKIKMTGSGYVFIGAYPNELAAYTSITPPAGIMLEQVLVWTYKNTLGNNPKDRYKLNWQAILFYRGQQAPPLDCPLTAEQWAVMDLNAPDGRLGNRFHAWQKPLELAERFIRHTTKPGDTVLDPFCCTGTFLLAANKLGRIGLGAEINSDNAAIAIERGCVYAA